MSHITLESVRELDGAGRMTTIRVTKGISTYRFKNFVIIIGFHFIRHGATAGIPCACRHSAERGQNLGIRCRQFWV